MAIACRNTPNGRFWVCTSCDVTWLAEERWHRWPIRIRWAKPVRGLRMRWFAVHGWETGRDAWQRTWYGRTVHFGRLKILLGPIIRNDWPGWICPFCGAGEPWVADAPPERAPGAAEGGRG